MTENKEMKENVITRQVICLYAENEKEAAEMVKNNIKYSYTDYNTIDKVIEVVEGIQCKLNDNELWNVNNPVNPNGEKDWELNRRNILF